MYCPRCGQVLEGHCLESRMTATAFKAICRDCGIAYQVVVDDQCPQYITIQGEPWEESDEQVHQGPNPTR